MEVFGERLRCYQIAPVLNSPKSRSDAAGRQDNGSSQGTLIWMHRGSRGGILMLELIIIVLVVLWLLGFFGRRGGNFIHLLLVVALILLIVRFVR